MAMAAAVAIVVASTVVRAYAATTVPPSFVQEIVASGFDAPTDMAFLPDGRMLVAEHAGLIKLTGPGGTTTTFLDLRSKVNNYGERGLIGIAVDPQFQQNGFVYAYYVYEHDASNPTGPKTARLSRFLTVGDTANPASETVLLGTVPGDSCASVTADCIPSDFRDHHGGTIRFAADDTIFLSTGDGATVHGVTPNALRSQNLDSLAGKILHVDRAGQGLPGNPFWTGSTADNRSKVWAYGFRNPFRFALRPSSGIPYVGDVGWDTTEEIDVARAGANFGWPCFEGTPRQPGYEPQSICQALYAQGPSAVTAPLVEWPHTAGGGCAVGGTFYTGTQFPTEYQGAFFYADYAQHWIRYLRTGPAESLISGPTDFATGAGSPVDLEIGPDGSLYYVSINIDVSGNVVGTGEIGRIRYSAGNRPPAVVAAGTPGNGLAPLDVAFSSIGTSDPDGDPLSLDWDFGDGSPHSTASAPTHRYSTNGTYTARLTATDGRGGQASAQVIVTVGNRAPTPAITAPTSAFRYAVGDVVDLTGTATDPDEGDTVTLSWVVTLQHCPLGACHSHPFLNGTGSTLSFVAPDHGDDSYFSVRLTATDSGGLSTTVTQQVQPQTAVLTLATQPSGLQLVYDGVTVTTPATKTVIVGSTHQVRAPSPQAGQLFSSWEDASPNDRQLVVTADRTVTATFVPSPVVVSDSFTRADALTLGAGWSATTKVGGSSCLLAISANQAAYPAGKSGTCEQYWTADPTQTDGVGSFTVTALPPEGGEIDVEGRMQALGTSQAVLYEGAWLRHTAGPDTYYIVRRNSNGSWTTLATINGPDTAVGDQLAFKLAGSSLSIHRKPAGASTWTQIIATSDTTIPGPGRLGLEFYNASGAKADDWTISPDLPGSSPGAVPVNSGLPTITGTAQVGQTLTGTTGSWTGTAPISYSQQWQRCTGATCNPISGATSLTYVPVAADVGQTLRLQVTASNASGPSLPANSAATATVTAAAGAVPVNSGLPTITGTAQVGQTLTGTTGSWTGTAPISYSQQWQRCTGATCNPISGATSLTYVPVAADVGQTLRLQVTASNASGPSLPANSAATATVTAAAGAVPVNSGLPTITGTAQVGQTLTGTTGSWTGTAPISYSQQWQRCTGATCNPISGATSLTYVPVAADVGQTLRLQVTASNASGPSLPANSAATATVTAAGGTAVSDSFTRADALTLGAGWSATTKVGGSSCLLAISANQAAYPAGKSGTCEQYWTADPTQTDGVGSFTVTALPPEGGEIDVEGRMQALGTSQAVLYEGAWLRHTAGPDTYYIVRRNSNGSWTTLATINGPDTAVGDQLAFKLAGSSLSIHRKPAGASTWTQIIATSDTTIPGPGRLGLEFYNASGAKADDWTISPDLPGSSPGAVPVNSGLPTITGTAQVGQTLTGTTGSWTGTAPISYSQQWQRCTGATCNPISGATSLTYVPVAADVGQTLRLQVTASNASGPSLPANSAATATVTAAAGAVPVNSGLPTITGTAQVGQTLTGTTGSWTGTAPISYSQQWQRCTGATCNPISGATSLTYVPVAADVGQTLRLQVTASNASGPSLPANSAATATVTAAGGTAVSDSFTRADALTLGAGWSATTKVGGSSCLLAISANQAAYPAGKSGTCEQYWTADPTQTDGVGSFTVTALPPEGGEIDVEGRMQALGTSQAVLYEGAWLRHTAGPDTYYIVRRNSNGSWTTLATINGPDTAVGDQLAFKLAGSSLSIHRKPAGASTWTQIIATSDTTIPGPGRLGLEFYNASGAKADDWTISPDLP